MTVFCNKPSALAPWGWESWPTPEGLVLLPVVPLGPELDRWLVREAVTRTLETDPVGTHSEDETSR